MHTIDACLRPAVRSLDSSSVVMLLCVGRATHFAVCIVSAGLWLTLPLSILGYSMGGLSLFVWFDFFPVCVLVIKHRCHRPK